MYCFPAIRTLGVLVTGAQNRTERRDFDAPTLEEYILRILGEASEALFSFEIAERLNKELRPDRAYSTAEVVKLLKGMSDQVAQLSDGRWMLKRLML